jgi:DNA (cytosine-5)-methyltransferase 1
VKTHGSLFAGIEGFGIGFERAGWKTVWQVEWNAINRAVLADRFPDALQLRDVRSKSRLEWVDCITFGSPCTDISNMGATRRGGKRGIEGPQSSLFFDALRVIDEIQPTWLVFENVPALLHSNAGEDLQRVIGEFAQRNYLGYARVLDAQYFGVPQKRRRLFLVAGLGRYPSLDYLADADPVESLHTTLNQEQDDHRDRWAGYTLTAAGDDSDAKRLNLGSEVLVAEADGWDQMLEWEREVAVHGLRVGLDAANSAEAFAAGNAVVPAIAEWIAQILNRS